MKSITVVTCAVCLITLVPRSNGQSLATLYTITANNPIGLAWAKGALYGTTFDDGTPGGFNCGTVYRLQPPVTKNGPWVGTVLYGFPSAVGDPCAPVGAPVVGAGGTLYGITARGAYNTGAFYGLQPPESPDSPWVETDLFDFGAPGTNIDYPLSGLVKGPGGSFYVLTSAPNLCRLQPPTSLRGAWTATVLYTFPVDAPSGPPNSLVAGPNGVLYGTSIGGVGLGDILQFTPPASPGGAWTETVLHILGAKDGLVAHPIALTVAADGTIYGTAYGSDPPYYIGGDSAIFRLTPPAAPGGQWTYTNLTTPTKTEHFNTPVVLVNGNLYGGTSTGTGGSIFELQPPTVPGGAWTLTTLYTFTDGQIPSGNLVAGPSGAIYGTTAATPGQPSSGTVFAITVK
jgi:hypothetical protein